jgi:hypothetical protein
MRRLAALIEGCATRVNLAVVDRTFRDPFWEGRFGDRARALAEDEGRRRLQYLVEALASHDQNVTRNYARWSRGQLVNRGLCSRHLVDGFESLGAALTEELGPDAARALEYLEAATEALRYPESPARELHDDAEVIAAIIRRRLEDRHPEGSPLVLAPDDVRTARDARYYVSYLADTIAAARPELFTAHVAWATTFLERRGVDRATFRELLDLVAEQVSPRAPAAAELIGTAGAELERVA